MIPVLHALNMSIYVRLMRYLDAHSYQSLDSEATEKGAPFRDRGKIFTYIHIVFLYAAIALLLILQLSPFNPIDRVIVHNQLGSYEKGFSTEIRMILPRLIGG